MKQALLIVLDSLWSWSARLSLRRAPGLCSQLIPLGVLKAACDSCQAPGSSPAKSPKDPRPRHLSGSQGTYGAWVGQPGSCCSAALLCAEWDSLEFLACLAIWGTAAVPVGIKGFGTLERSYLSPCFQPQCFCSSLCVLGCICLST